MSITILSSNPILNRSFPAGPALFFLLSFLSTGPLPPAAAGQNEEAEFARARREMVDRQLRARRIQDPKVLEAMSRVPRHHFVSEQHRGSAYHDRPVPIGEGQTISQPYVVALMSEAAELRGDETVLEIGTGSGYQAAVLSRLVKEVYSVEIIPALAARARENLARLGYRNAWIKEGDGFFGWREKGPFDAILVTAAAEKVPAPLWQQLREEGRLVMPLGSERQGQRLVRIRKKAGKQHLEDITGVLFVPMTGTIQSESR
ncbi:MAG: protein-L-isoaspartate(D-aspartate) O-methyltransferase [Deltaproteobacteria bacterium]|nr:protein-L-isoaspartate(D-aspartate) O-methyltransferase [Deltaproteobacteria bacterium]MBI2538257.1 protein-L-isoaspartate(D-aspartate) O-methyltransferase [Deltaproteobacteria bacterium]